MANRPKRRVRRNAGIPVNQEFSISGRGEPPRDPIEDLLTGTTKFPAVFQRGGGVAELSEWGGNGALWTRSKLRSETVTLLPVSVEGMWYVAAVVRALADGQLGGLRGGDDASLKQAAWFLSFQLDQVRGLYDS